MAEHLLSLLDWASSPGLGRFAVAEHYRSGHTVDGIMVVEVNPTFRWNLLHLVEDPVAEAKLKVFELLKNAYDRSVFRGLAGSSFTSLGRLWQFLVAAPRDAYYVTNVYGMRRAMFSVSCALDRSSRLSVSAREISAEDPFRLSAGDQLIMLA